MVDESNGEDGLAEGPEGDQPMSFLDHLGELRKRLTRAVLAVALGFFASFAFAEHLTWFLKWPLLKAWTSAGRDGTPILQAINMQDSLMVDVRVALTAGIFLAIPIIFYQLWMFISPGLYSKEKKFVIPFVFFSALLFLIGAAFAFVYVIPFIYQFFIEYGAERGDLVQPELNSYYKGTSRILLAFGLVFEFPLLAAFLAKFGVITERTLLRFWKMAMLVIFVLAAFLTPPEPISQLMMAGPMVCLYFISVGVAWIINPQSKVDAMYADGATESEDADDAAGDDNSGEDDTTEAVVSEFDHDDR